MSDGNKKLKGAAATKHNKQRFNEEIAKMEAMGEKFPANQHGSVSVDNFAKRCGFTSWVITEGALTQDFQEAVERIGVSTRRADQDVAVRLQQKCDDNQRLSSELQKALDIKTIEVEGLQKQVEDLTKRVNELKLRGKEKDRSLDHMLTSGERFFL